eukprot:scaffold635_cov311-Pinguiococcus_pyrenoidosus.AAC.19
MYSAHSKKLPKFPSHPLEQALSIHTRRREGQLYTPPPLLRRPSNATASYVQRRCRADQQLGAGVPRSLDSSLGLAIQ